MRGSKWLKKNKIDVWWWEKSQIIICFVCFVYVCACWEGNSKKKSRESRCILYTEGGEVMVEMVIICIFFPFFLLKKEQSKERQSDNIIKALSIFIC
eukprot:UN10745